MAQQGLQIVLRAVLVVHVHGYAAKVSVWHTTRYYSTSMTYPRSGDNSDCPEQLEMHSCHGKETMKDCGTVKLLVPMGNHTTEVRTLSLHFTIDDIGA